MKWIRRGALFLLAIAPLVLLIINSNEGWHGTYGLWENWRYLLNDLLLAVMAIECAVVGFLLRKRSRIFTGIGLSLASLLLCLVLLDLYVVVLCHESTGPGGIMCITHRNWYERIAVKNEQDYWERELTAYMPANRPEELTVIAAVGDSFTWGQGLQNVADRYTNRLDRALGDDVVVLNFGRGGYDTRDLINRILPDVEPLEPDIVVMFYLSNDIHDGLTKVAPPPPPPPGKWEHRLLVGSPTWNYLYWKVFYSLQYEGIASEAYEKLYSRYEDEDNFKDHKDDLKAFARKVRESGAVPLLVNLPFPHLWAHATEERGKRVRERVQEALKESGMPLLDLSDLEERFPVGEFEVNSMDAHPSSAVHAAIAERVKPWLQTFLHQTSAFSGRMDFRRG